MTSHLTLLFHSALVFYLSLSSSIHALDSTPTTPKRRGYSKGDLVPVTCLNRTIETGEHITDAHGNLQYIPFPTCNETSQPLSFEYLTPRTQTCTIDLLSDELYHLLEFFVHSDVPLTCRVPSWPLDQANQDAFLSEGGEQALIGEGTTGSQQWTPFTIALQGTLQLSHLHLHTNINVLFHTSTPSGLVMSNGAPLDESHLIASTAYSLPHPSSPSSNTTTIVPLEGTKILRNEPLIFNFNVGWIDGAVLPGMVGRPLGASITDHRVGFSLLSLSALLASAGVGAMGMLVYERRKRGKSAHMNGLLGGNTVAGRSTGYGGYGGYVTGKRD